MEHRLKRNTLTKIVVLYLSLFLVFGVLFISLYSSCYRILYRDTLSKSESRLNAGLEAFRDDLTRMMLLVNDYSATDEYLLLRAVNDPATVQNSLAMNKACEKLHSILDIENSYVKQVYSLFLNNNLFLSDRTSSMDYGQSFGILIRSKSGTLSAQDWKRSHFDSILPIRLLNGSDISSAYLPEDTNLLLCVVKTDNVTRKASDVVVFMIDADALMETLIDPDMLKSSTLRLTDGENALLCSSRGHVDPGEISLTIQATDSAFDLHAELTVPKSYFSNQLKSLTSIVRIYMFVGILGIFALLLVLIVRQYRPLSGLITLSARYGGEGLDDRGRYMLLLQTMRGQTTRAAHFTCAIACAFPNGDTITAEGQAPGTIAFAPMGEGGFGYDPVFFVPDKAKTFAQLTQEEKAEISHRGKALREFTAKLETYLKK